MIPDTDDLTGPEPVKRSLSDRVARGAAWIVGGRILVRSMGLINTLILARLLVPEDFGLVAIGVTVMQLLENISDIGVSRTVVKFRNAGREHFDTLFTLSIAKGIFVSLILLCLAPFAGAFYDDPRTTMVFYGLALVPIFSGLMNPRFFEFERDLNFSKEFMMKGINKAIGVAISVTIALVFRNFWAIIAGILAGNFIQMLLSYIMRPYMPKLSLSAIREIGSFTGWLTGHSFVTALNNKLDVLFLGKLIPAGDVGAYFVGGSVASLPSGEIASPIARAIYPGLSELQNDPATMREGYLRGVEALALIVMPAAFGFSFVAEDLVVLLLGPQWDQAVLMLRYFSPAAGVMVIFSATNAYAMAKGEAKLLFWREVIVFCLRMPALVLAAAYYGLTGAVLAAAGGLLLIASLNAGLYQRLSGNSFSEPFWRARRPIAGVAIMTFYFLIFRPDLGTIDDMPLIIRLGIDGLSGVFLYSATILFLWRIEGFPKGVEAMIKQRIQGKMPFKMVKR